MIVGTGITIYETILSINADNVPVTGATFDTSMYKDGNIFVGIPITINLIDSVRAIYSASWSADTTGDYQLYAKNNITSVIFISNNVSVKSDSELSTSIYIGL